MAGSPVEVASVATAFPSGRASLAVKLADVADAVRGRGRDRYGHRPRARSWPAGTPRSTRRWRRCGTRAATRTSKVILETGELATLDNVARAAWLAMIAGADFIKTSTGKVSPAATPPVALVMLSAVRDFAQATGRRVGVKVAGGIRTTKDAIRYLVLVREVAGPAWLTPALFPIGASTLLNDLLMQRSKQLRRRLRRGYFTLD